MSEKTKWARLCGYAKVLTGKGLLENVFHDSFKCWMKTIFNWPETNIEKKVLVMKGAELAVDIVAEGKDFILVIEMERPDVIPNEGNAGQLIYYMRNLSVKLRKSCPYGLLVGKEIQVFYDNDPTKAQDEIKPVVHFDFNNPANPYGIALGEVLDYYNCSDAKLREYVEETVPRIKAEEVNAAEEAKRTAEEERKKNPQTSTGTSTVGKPPPRPAPRRLIYI